MTKVVNKTNGMEVEKLEKVYGDDFYQCETFQDALHQIKFGLWAVVPNWEMVDNLLDCFDDNEDFIVEKVGNTFYVCRPDETRPRSKAQLLNQMKRMKDAYAKGEIFELEQIRSKD